MLDCKGRFDNELWFDSQSSFPDRHDDKTFNKVGNCLFRSSKHQLFFFDAESFEDHDLDDVVQSFIS